MDPLFERRELTKKVNIHAKFMQKDIKNSLLSQLKVKYQGRCSAEGYIHRDSLVITNYSLGRADIHHPGVDYMVTFQADVCLPHIGQTFKAPVKLRSKIGIHAEVSPINILIPRDLHIGNAEFDNMNVGDEIEFEVVGSQFKQGDENIVVVGKLKSKIPQPPEVLGQTEDPPPFGELTPAPSSGNEKSVMITPVAGEDKKKLRKKKTAT